MILIKNLFALTLMLFIFSAACYAQEEREVISIGPMPVQEADNTDSDTPYPFAVIEELPRFKECDTVAIKQIKDCFNEMLNKHIRKNFNYPVEAQKAGFQGRVSVLFTINKEGVFTDFKVRGPKNGKLLEEEALRIMHLLPKITPGKQRGKPVNVRYAVPFVFRLD